MPVEVSSGNVIVNNAHVHGNGNDDGDDDDDEDDDEDDDDDDEDDDEDDDDNHHHHHYELKVDKDTYMAPGYRLMADGIQIKKNALIESDVYANDLDNKGNITGDIFSAVVTPLFNSLPPFKSAPAGSQNITVKKNQELVLEPGDYRRIMVKDRGILILTGGVYNIEKLEAKKHSHIRFEEATEIRVERKIKISKQAYVGPANNSFIGASDIIFYISGDEHHVAKLEERVEFYGTIYTMDGKVELKKKTLFTGAILAPEVKVDKESVLTLDSFFDQSTGTAKLMAWSSEPEMEADVPTDFTLNQNYPNPFNPSTTISYALSDEGFVSIRVYDLLGREVAVLVNKTQEAGRHQVRFEAGHLSSGAYLYVLKTGSYRSVKKMVYMK
ncbi:MAG: T9SS type A sorting domain-containing protein [Candidatus Marinimicrobia bacterium]|nr:T9SS type A sorting domain-containing protein [Candidatus Neomarinimicrobiota bacterium]